MEEGSDPSKDNQVSKFDLIIATILAPGLGHFQIGKKRAGVIIFSIFSLLFVYICIMLFFSIWGIESDSASIAEIQRLIIEREQEHGYIKKLFIGLICSAAVVLYAIIDLLRR
ncbi:MAG: hypothetical protein ACN4E2_03095 [Nitrospinota bacterium]